MTQKAVAERRSQVLQARQSGMSWEQIARTVPGVKDAAAAVQDHQRALKSSAELRVAGGEDRAGARELELRRLESLTLAAEGVLRAAAADPDKHDQVLRAVDRLSRLSARRMDLLGLGQQQQPGQGGGGEDELAARRLRVSARRQNLG
jgi:hypothetical protein